MNKKNLQRLAEARNSITLAQAAINKVIRSNDAGIARIDSLALELSQDKLEVIKSRIARASRGE